MTITLDDIRDQLRRHSPGKQDNHAYALPMVAAMEERAEVDAAYTIALYQWLANGSSILLRDALCRVFANDDFVLIPAMGFVYPWEECWTAIDSAWGAVAFEKGIAPAATEEAPTAPADEVPDGCDSRLSPCGTYMIHEHDCPEAIEHGWPREDAPGAHAPNAETVAALEDSRAGRVHRAKDLHGIIVDAVAEALAMQGDGTGDNMTGVWDMQVQKPYDNDAIWAAFYRDGKTLAEIKEEFGLSSIYELTPWLAAPLMNAPDPDVRARAELPKIEVEVTAREWERQGHGGTSKETDYAILLNGHRLRGYSTHGNMQEGYWGSAAKTEAEKYAAGVRAALGLPTEEGK